MTVRFTMKSGKQYTVGNLTRSFHDFISKELSQVTGDGFMCFNDIAIKVKEIECVEEIK